MTHRSILIYIKMPCDRGNRYGMIGRIPDGRSAWFQALPALVLAYSGMV